MHRTVTGQIRNSLDTQLTAEYVGLAVANAMLAEGRKNVQSSSSTSAAGRSLAAAAAVHGPVESAGGPAEVAEARQSRHTGAIKGNNRRDAAAVNIPVSGSSAIETRTSLATKGTHKLKTTATSSVASHTHQAHQPRVQHSAVPPPPPPPETKPLVQLSPIPPPPPPPRDDRSRGALSAGSCAGPPVLEAWTAAPSTRHSTRAKISNRVAHNPPSGTCTVPATSATTAPLPSDDGAREETHQRRGRSRHAHVPGTAAANNSSSTAMIVPVPLASGAFVTSSAAGALSSSDARTRENKPRRATAATATLTRSRPQPLDGSAGDNNNLGPMSLHRRATVDGGKPSKIALARGGAGKPASNPFDTAIGDGASNLAVLCII